MVDAVEHVVRPAIPELPVVEDGVDHRWSVARLDPPRIRLAHVEPLGIELAARVVHSLRRYGIVAVGQRVERTGHSRCGKTGERKIGGPELRVRAGRSRVRQVGPGGLQ